MSDAALVEATSGADRILIVDDGLYSYDSANGADTLVTITNLEAIAEFNARLRFRPTLDPGRCSCSGYPRLEWYRGKERVAFASVQHGKRLRWKGFGYDVPFASETVRWWKQFAQENRIPDGKVEPWEPIPPDSEGLVD